MIEFTNYRSELACNTLDTWQLEGVSGGGTRPSPAVTKIANLYYYSTLFIEKMHGK